MGGIGNCCDVAQECFTQCSAYIPATTWTVAALGKTLNLTQDALFKCQYQAEICWLDDAQEEAAWSDSDGWEDDPSAAVSIYNPCVAACDGLTFDIVQSQTHYRTDVKLFSQVHNTLYVAIGPATPTSNLLQMAAVYTIAKTWFYGASQTAHTRYRVSERTCPDALTTGSWVSGTAPTMPTVLYPPSLSDCVAGVLFNFADSCPITLGPAYSAVTWGTHSVGTFRELRNIPEVGCSVITLDLRVADDVARQQYQELLIATSACCDSRRTKSRTYVSASFACDAIPSTIACPAAAGAIAATSVSASCGAHTYTDAFPALPGSITVTL